MATFVNNLRLKEIATGDESGTWGTSTNTNLELITDGFSLGTKQMSADANETFTMPDASADATRALYLKITSASSLTATREVTLGPNTISKTWIIENATTGSQIITIKQGSGATVNIPSGAKVMIVTDGLGAGAAVFNANPSSEGGVTSVGGTGTVNGISLSGTVTSSGNLTLGGALSGVNLTSQVTGTLPTANGGTGGTSAATGTGGVVLMLSPSLTTPKITTGIDDSAGNLVIPIDSNQYFSGTFSDKVVALGNTGTAITLNANLGNVFTATLNGNATLTLATPNSASNRATSFTLVLTNDATASRTLALAGGTFKYPGGAIARTTTAQAVDIWFFFSPDNGTTWYVTIPMKNLTT
tara:strand:+ start:2056 stop:3129 length:1074 start_codon:yes stop_codon:yes gene_type:complete